MHVGTKGIKMEIFKNYVRLDHRLYLKCKKYIAKHRRLSLIEHLIDSVEADSAFSERLKEHDNFFKPTTEYEKRLWDSCRELAKEDIETLKKKVNGGKKSAEIRKQKKEEPIRHPAPAQKPVKGAFVAPTQEEVLKYAKEMNEYAGLGGFVCSQEEAQLFYDYYSGIGWCLPNEHSTPIREWKPFLRKWVKNPRRYATKVASQMSVKEIKAAENHVKLQKMLNGEL